MAQPGGVLARAGHTEASVDLAMLAGLEPAAVLVEILSEDGSMARRAELEAFASEHGLAIGTIADLIRYRMQNEGTVSHESVHEVQTDFGAFMLHCFRDTIANRLHLALVRGTPDPDKPFLVRVHVQNPLSDLLSIRRKDFGLPLRKAMAYIGSQPEGMLLLLGGHPDDDDLQKLVEQNARSNVDAAGDDHASRELRTYGIGAQIISDLGVRKMKVLSAPRRLSGLSGFGLEIVEYIEPESDAGEEGA